MIDGLTVGVDVSDADRTANHAALVAAAAAGPLELPAGTIELNHNGSIQLPYPSATGPASASPSPAPRTSTRSPRSGSVTPMVLGAPRVR